MTDLTANQAGQGSKGKSNSIVLFSTEASWLSGIIDNSLSWMLRLWAHLLFVKCPGFMASE